ncbi:hypothetical protein [Sphaerimonospora thailandensis]|uniref:Transporter n=1 Tax=Sphaerimonospora thailandensis TaxID=795644 RepID=A0A8J3R9E6_9ACTN|nr:hypothetical protein [Sphaerimonospora thailandensis]GIH70469.1 transporter [Sphaerimonospora thailandensis]
MTQSIDMTTATGAEAMGTRATVALFVRLKLRLIRGNLRGDLAKQLGFVFSCLAAGVVAVLGFVLFAVLRLAPADIARDVGIVVFTVVAIGWIFVPLMAFGLDETLDPARLTLFPLTTRQLVAGMFAASAAGPWPIASLVMLSGGVVALASGPGGVLIGLPAVLLQFAFCLVVSRAVTTALSGALRSRRGRDLLTVGVVFFIVLTQIPGLIINRGLPGDPRELLAATAGVLRWSPPGLAAHAIADGGLAGVAEIVVLAVVVAVLAWLWIVALRRALVTPDSSYQGGAVRRSRMGSFLPGGMLGAVVAKELKYARREPRGRMNWLVAVVVSAILMFSLRGRLDADGPALVIGPIALAALMMGMQAANSFGIDGRSLWMNAVAFATVRDVRTDLAGRHLAYAIVALPLLAVLSVFAAVTGGDPWLAVAATATGWGVMGVALGVGAMVSVLLPYTFPERLNAFSGAAPGQGGQAFAATFAAMTGTAVLVLPVVVPVMFGLSVWAVVAVPYGLAVAWGGRRLAALIGYRRIPDILAAVSRPT